jgi:flagellar basal-body rod protein FlgB
MALLPKWSVAMNTGQTDLLGLAASRLGWLDDRQRVLARNIANADTPGYVPRDEQSFSKSLADQTMAPAQTNAMHLAGSADLAGTTMERPRQRSIDGNAVALDEQMTKVADTDTQQRLVTTLYGKYMSMYSTALGKG